MPKLEGKVAIVTGAGSGMGLEMSRRFAEEGASVVAADVSEEGLRRAGEAEGVSVVRADVSSARDVEGMIGAAIEVPPSNAMAPSTCWSTTPASWTASSPPPRCRRSFGIACSG